MTRIRTLARIVALAYIFSLMPTGAFAQVLPGRVSGAGMAPAQLAPGTQTSTAPGATYDVFFGRDAKGPYTLSWKPIDRFTESIYIDGKVLVRDLDYDINYGAGSITFKTPVDADSIIRAEYSYDPDKAKKNAAPLSVPLSLDLVNKGSADLQLVALYKQSDAKSAPDTMIYGLTGNTKAGQGQVDSMFLFSPDTAGQEDISFGDRSAVKLDGSTETDDFKLSASYLHVGEKFAGAKDYKLNQGADALDIAAAFKLGSKISLSSTIKRTEDSVGKKKGHMDASAAHSMVFAPSDTSKLSVTRTETEKEKPGKAAVKTTTDRAVFDQKIGSNLSATASHESVTTDTGGNEVSVDTEQVGINYKATENTTLSTQYVQKDSSATGKATNLGVGVDSRLSDKMKLSADMNRATSDKAGQVNTESITLRANPTNNMNYQVNVGHKDSEATGNEFSQGLSVSLSPAKSMSVKASVDRADSEKLGQRSSESLSVVANPNQLLNLQMNLAHKSVDGSGEELAHSIKLVSDLRPDTRMEYNMTGKDVAQDADEALQALKLSTKALKKTTIDFNWTNKTSDVKGDQQIAGVQIQAAPTDKIKISGAVGQTETADSRQVNREARVEVNPSNSTKLSGGLKETETNGAVVARVTDIGAAVKPADFLHLSSSYRQRDYLNQDCPDSLDVALQIDTGGFLKFTGAYTTNPEDKKGNVQQVNNQSYGIVSDFGRLKLNGAYTLRDQYLAGKTSEKTEVGLDYRLSANAKLSTSYSIDALQDASLLATEVYSLGYTQNVGSTLNVYLGGKMTLYERDKVLLEDQTDVQAEARVGVKW